MTTWQLEDDVQLVVDTFSSGPASRKAAHLQDFYTLLCSPIRNGNMRGDVFWETFGRLWARSNRHVCLSQYLAMCLRLRANKPVEEDPVWFVADAKNFDSDEMLAGFDGELLFRVIDGDQGARMYVALCLTCCPPDFLASESENKRLKRALLVWRGAGLWKRKARHAWSCW